MTTTTNYNYMEVMKSDIRQYLNDNAWKENITDYTDFEDFTQHLNDDLWTCDSVTGNASGSYTFNRAEAKEYVLANIDLLKEAYEEFCCKEKFADEFFEENFEVMDVTIRCYLLSSAIAEVVEEDEMEEAFNTIMEELEEGED